ncbi:chemosensory receptor A [Elysia marginata]|uniref:Chemosensory receptor A n=1 Tax=Elysia marginata TaxID=1093978 RepID=A0AAV4G3N7_9GAST|nr:chemosensory receptor A [Elysia marginata]
MELFNNETASHNAMPAILHEPISDEELSYLSLVLKLIVNPALEVLGIFANFINMAVFYKMGLSDGVTQNFFILSMSDCLILAIALVNSITYILQERIYAGKHPYVEIVHLASFLATTFPQTFSLIITVVIAVVRCCCVAMPLRVKYLLTAGRQLAAILVFSTGALCMLMYAFAPLRVIYIHSERVNSTLPMFINLKWYAYTLFTNIFFNIGFVIVIICVIILTISLNRSSKFRETSTSGADVTKQTKEGRKEARVVKTVVFLCIIFILCYLPTMIFSIFGHVESEFSKTGFYRNANIFFLMFLEFSLMVNANVNIFVYYLYNSRYRTVFRSMCGVKEQ